MKNVMKQIGKALCYFILYFLGQSVVAFIIQYGMGMYLGMQMRASGMTMTQEETIAYANNFYAENMGLDLAARAIFTLAFLAIFFAIRKKKIAKELDLKKVPAKFYLPAILGILFIMFTVNNCMSLLMPQDSLEEFQQASSVLYAYPLWQAILANVLLVPILEEVIFRGVLFSRLQKAMPNVVVAIITSALFGLMHGQALWMLFAFIMGQVVSYVRVKTGSILPTIVMHVINNLYATLVSYAIIKITSAPIVIAMMILGAISMVGCIILMKKFTKEEATISAKAEVSTVVI